MKAVHQPRAENVLFQFFLTQQSVREVMLGVVAGTGITQDEYAVLGLIVFTGPIAPTELASRIGMAPTTISRYAAAFVERGLARRRPNPSDGRSYLLEGTEEARKVVDVIVPRLRNALSSLAEASSMPLEEIHGALVELGRASREVAAVSTTR